MIFDWDRVPTRQVTELVAQAAARTGFTTSDIEAMVDSELETSHLLEYITAVMSNRMN